MECEKCQDRGFIEKEHGLIVVLCDCDKAREVAERNGIPLRENADVSLEVSSEIGRMTEEVAYDAADVIIPELDPNGVWGVIGVIDDTIDGAGPDNQPVGSGDTGKPKLSKKRKAKNKARARTI